MATLDRELIRKMASWETDGLPVTSLYLDVDGRRWPRRSDYVRRTILGRASLALAAPADEVLAAVVDPERELEGGREREAVKRLTSEMAGGTGRAVAGLDDTLIALEGGRVEVLVVAAGLEPAGVRCSRCGHLASGGDRCAVCGGPVTPVPDLVEEAVELALRQHCRVEGVADGEPLRGLGGIGALLRF